MEEIGKKVKIEPNVIQNITQTLIDRYMDKYARFGGEPKQVLLRVPVGLIKNIDEYQSVLGFYDNRADFIRMAVANQLAIDESFNEKLGRVKDHKVQQKLSNDEIIQSVLQKFSENKEGINGLATMLDIATTEVINKK